MPPIIQMHAKDVLTPCDNDLLATLNPLTEFASGLVGISVESALMQCCCVLTDAEQKVKL